MEDSRYSIRIIDLSIREHIYYPDTFSDYCDAVTFMFRKQKKQILEDEIIEAFKDNPDIQKEWERGNQGMHPIETKFPNRFKRDTIYPKAGGEENEGIWGWFDLWDIDEITQDNDMYDLFFAYKLRQTDLLIMDDVLNYFHGNYTGTDTVDFIRFLKLTLRKHSRLLEPEIRDTINEWIAEREKDSALSGTMEARTKGRPKRQRDDKVTLLNQEQTALLIYCLRETRVIFSDEFLNNKEAGQAFSILTGYSADTIRQNLNKSELSNLATVKNIEVVEKALQAVVKYVCDNIKPE